MKKKLLLAATAFAAALAMSNTALAQTPPPQNVAQLSANGQVEVTQDLLMITMSTSREGTDANVVQTQLKQALDTALTEAKKTAQAGQMDVRTGNFSLNPRYGRDGKMTGWAGSAELVLEGRDFTRITSAAGKIQTLTMAGVGFGLSREQRAKAEAESQVQAIDRFKAKALEVTKNFGFAGYTLREVSINSNDQGVVRPRMMAMEAKVSMSSDSAVPVEAGKTTVVTNVSGSVQMK